MGAAQSYGRTRVAHVDRPDTMADCDRRMIPLDALMARLDAYPMPLSDTLRYELELDLEADRSHRLFVMSELSDPALIAANQHSPKPVRDMSGTELKEELLRIHTQIMHLDVRHDALDVDRADAHYSLTVWDRVVNNALAIGTGIVFILLVVYLYQGGSRNYALFVDLFSAHLPD